MAKELEIEYKNLLTKLEYQNLLEITNLTKENIHEQTNIYFDTKNGILKEKDKVCELDYYHKNRIHFKSTTKKQLYLFRNN